MYIHIIKGTLRILSCKFSLQTLFLLYIFQGYDCHWSDESPLSYRNYELHTKFSRALRSLRIHNIIHNSEVFSPGQRLVGILSNTYKRDNSTEEEVSRFNYNLYQDTLGKRLTNIKNVSILCTYVATHLFIQGQWFVMGCHQRVQTPLVICERYHTSDVDGSGTMTNASIYHLQIRRTRCNSEQQYFLINLCYKLLHTKWPLHYRRESPDLNLTKNNDTKDISTDAHIMLAVVLGKWTYGLTDTVNLWRNSTHVQYFQKLCRQCVVKYASWKYFDTSIDRIQNVTGAWLCRTDPVLNWNGTCSKEFYRCADGTCILRHYLCDGIQHCRDNSDELGCSLDSDYFKYNISKYCCHERIVMFLRFRSDLIPMYQWYQVHRWKVLDDLTDTQKPNKQFVTCPIGWSRCSNKNKTYCYPNSQVCVFERDPYGSPLYCPNTGNLEDCSTMQLTDICPSMFRCEKSYCIPFHMVRLITELFSLAGQCLETK